MKILITGGTGFIGSRLALSYLKEGHAVEVIGQTNTPAEKSNSIELEQAGAKIHHISVTDREAVFNAIKNFDFVFHLAAAQHEMNISDKRFWEVNVEGTHNMLDAAASSKIRKFVHGSTIGVYGNIDGEIDESAPLNPDNIYGKTKLEAEKLAISYKDKLNVTVVRIPEVYGPGDMRLLKLFKAIKKNLFFTIGDGENLHHLIFIDDLVEGFKKLACSGNSVGDLYLFAGKEAVTTNHIMKSIAKTLGKSSSKVHIPLALVWGAAVITEKIFRPLGIQPPIHTRRIDFFKKSFTLCSKKAERSFGFSPKTNFDEGALQTAEWYKNKGLI